MTEDRRAKAIANSGVSNFVPRHTNLSNGIKGRHRDLIYTADCNALSNNAFHEHLMIVALKGMYDSLMRNLYNTRCTSQRKNDFDIESLLVNEMTGAVVNEGKNFPRILFYFSIDIIKPFWKDFRIYPSCLVGLPCNRKFDCV